MSPTSPGGSRSSRVPTPASATKPPRVLAARGARVVIAVRDTAKGDAGRRPRSRAAVPRCRPAGGQPLDLGSLESVRTAAEQLQTDHPRIDLLINNAGVMYPPKQTTADGFELQFGTNHLGHFALTGLLLENLLPVENSRVVTVASIAHRNPGRNRLRRSAVGAQLQPGRRLRAVQAGQPDVHLRTEPPPQPAGTPLSVAAHIPGVSEHRTDAAHARQRTCPASPPWPDLVTNIAAGGCAGHPARRHRPRRPRRAVLRPGLPDPPRSAWSAIRIW